MHEFIKYSIKLEDKVLPYDKIRVKTINDEVEAFREAEDDLSEEDYAARREQIAEIKEEKRKRKSDWQAILADNQYGTHYFLYAKFIGVIDNATGSMKLGALQLYLQNYTGPVTIGLAGTPKLMRVKAPQIEAEASSFQNPNKYKLFVPVQALNPDDVGEVFTINGENGVTLHPGDLLETVPIFKPMEQQIGDEARNPNNMRMPLFLDALFKARLGEDFGPTEIGDVRMKKYKEFQQMSTGFTEDLQEVHDNFDFETTGFSPAFGSGRALPCKPTNSVFHI